MRLPLSIPLCGLAASIGLSLHAQNPVVQGLVDAVNEDSLVLDLQHLSGEAAVDVGAGDQLIASRNKFNTGNALAATWLQQQLTAFGYAPTVQSFSATGGNVLAVKTGAVHPERLVVICGHYDALPGGPVDAPAADDDGSGTCGVLEAARVMAPLTFENTVVFAFWDEEEQGLVGSHYYAGAQAASDVQITGVVNMDAISYDGDGDGLLRIHTKPIANSLAIKDTALMVNTTYGLDLSIAVNNPGATYSDHASFWTEGYGAILIIEDFDDDPNPHYHTSSDQMQYIDTDYWHGLVQLGVGTAASLAVPYDNAMAIASPVVPEEDRLEVFPNPLISSGQVRLTTEQNGPARVTLLDAIGRPVRTLFDGMLMQGRHTLPLELGDLAPGAYLLCCSSGGSTRTLRLLRTP